MAKVQNLSLNPTKISGTCGRLMCCLRFESDTYQLLRNNLPEVGERVMTPEGIGKVIESSILEEKVKVRRIIEEASSDREEKLDDEVLQFDKKSVERLDASDRDIDDGDDQIPEEFKELLDD